MARRMGTKAPWLVLVLIRDFSRRLWLLRRNDFHVQHIRMDDKMEVQEAPGSRHVLLKHLQ